MPDPSRILVVRTDRLGDVILTLPVLTALRQCFPHAHLAMLLSRYAGAIVEGSPALDQIMYDDDERGLAARGNLMRSIRNSRFDACIVVHPTPRLAWLIWRSGIPLRVGTGYRFYSLLFNRRVYTHRSSAERHELEYNIELLSALGCQATPRKPLAFPLVVQEESQRSLDELLSRWGIRGNYAVIHPGSGGSAREWPREHFALLAAALADRPSLSVVVTGTAEEAPLAEDVVRLSGGRAVSLAGRLSVKELAALLGRAVLVAANSTGPLHLAAALNTPVLGFYPQIPVMGVRRWGPWTDKARVLVPEKPTNCVDCRSPGSKCACMASITVEAAIAAAQELLPNSPVAHAKAHHGS
ncbi:MAG TPA: glycosyltransferase family 9 protein [Bacteroidota bacterium]|nr:glycosyltransferase family 9 protein [Bacteroidota bacterium]